MPAYTRDTIALGIIAEGRRLGITERGIQIALATAIVESNLTMYANNSDPESLRFPHDAVGSDNNSVGVFQQRAPWWGTVAERMDVAGSARMFYEKLSALDYTNTSNSPGFYAQQVQRSAFPERYDQKFPQAQSIYRLLAGEQTASPAAVKPPAFRELNFMTGGGASSRSRPPINFFLHTQEGDGTAEGLARYCNGSNGVSYHYTLRDGVLCNVVDTDLYSWSVLNANNFSINLCFAGSFAGWSRTQWLRRERDIEIAAFIAVQDIRKYPTMSTRVIPPPYNYAGPGISDHRYVTRKLGIGTHTDVGDSFPWDVFTQYVNKYATGTTGDTGGTVSDDKKLPSRSPLRHLGEGPVDTWLGMDLNSDANLHVLLVKSLAEMGDRSSLKLLAEVATADPTRFPDRQRDADLARLILTDIEARRPDVIQKYLNEKAV